MSAAVHEVARNAQAAAEASRQADEQSQAGAQAVNATIQAMRAMAREVEQAQPVSTSWKRKRRALVRCWR